MSKQRIVVVEPGKTPVVREVTRGFEEAREIIGGYVELVRMGVFDVLCDEDGISKKLPTNRAILTGNGNPVAIRGTFVVTKCRDRGLATLTLAEANRIIQEMAS